MEKQAEMFTMTAKIHGILGKIIPEIELSIPKCVIYGVANKAAQKALKRELKKYMLPTSQPSETGGDTDTA